jgi:deoxyribodipyrimidine photolyase-related protein
MKKLRVIFCDQLSFNLSALADFDKHNDAVLMIESPSECENVKHHKKKLVFILSAMRHFSQEIKLKGYKIIYVELTDANNGGTLVGEIQRIFSAGHFDEIVITKPSEYRLYQELLALKTQRSIPIEILGDDRFLATPDEFAKWAENRKELRMEFFYREMRKKHGILIKDGLPVGGKWNYDAENRKFPSENLVIPPCYRAKPDKITQEVISLVAERFSSHFGDIMPFHFAVTRSQALDALAHFIDRRLANFGNFQDAMLENEPWMYHSHLSFYLNVGLLQPLECIKLAEDAFYQGKVSLNAAEGFIRQILGWREYVRGIYWLKMPEYKELNYFNASRELPNFFWTADTKMRCLAQCIKETKENAYAHHIQRLMVIGNFALLAGLHPDYVNEWYLLVYADAYEWVELPNVTGMILYADGGVLASKPYSASGAYINKMSNYCQGCQYKVSKKNGPGACPFNYLYWNFLLENRGKLQLNHRLVMIYAVLNKMNEEKIQAIREDAQTFFTKLIDDSDHSDK